MQDFQQQPAADPALVSKLIKQNEDALETVKQQIQSLSGAERLDFIREDIARMRQDILFDPQSIQRLVQVSRMRGGRTVTVH